MTWVIGAVAKGGNPTNPTTTCTLAFTATAGRSYLASVCGFQTGGGTRTITCTSDIDGAMTADLSSGAVADPLYLFRKDNSAGGTNTLTATASGNCLSMSMLITEVQVSAMVLKGAGVHATFSGTTAWDSGPFDTTAATEMLYTTLFITNRSDGVISACDDNNGNNYTVGQKEITGSGESMNDAYFFGTLAQENAEAEATVSVSGSGRLLVVAYGAASGGTTMTASPMVGVGAMAASTLYKVITGGAMAGVGSMVASLDRNSQTILGLSAIQGVGSMAAFLTKLTAAGSASGGRGRARYNEVSTKRRYW